MEVTLVVCDSRVLLRPLKDEGGEGSLRVRGRRVKRSVVDSGGGGWGRWYDDPDGRR